MIYFGSSLEVTVMCPDCDKPMQRMMRQYSRSLNIEGDFICVMCKTEDCINRYFTHTVEKKTGMVIYTNAAYSPPQNSDEHMEAVVC